MPNGDPEANRLSNQLYRASARIGQAVIRSRSRQELLSEVVKVMVDAGGFTMSFAAWHDPETQELKPVARFGDHTGYVDRIHVYADERPLGQGPAGIAFRTGKCYICHEFLHDRITRPWHDQATQSGWRASAAIPISMAGKACGIISAYSSSAWRFTPEDVELFEQVATDVSLGLDHLETEAQRRRIEAELADSQRRLHLAIEAAAIGTYEWDLTTGQVAWDQRSLQLFGYAQGGFDGTYSSFAARVHPDDRATVEKVMAQAMATGSPFAHDFRLVWTDGSIHWITSRGEFVCDEAGRPIRLHGVTFAVDEKKQAEQALRESDERLQQAVRVAGIGIFEHDHLRNRMYWSPELRAMQGRDADSPVVLDDYLTLLHPDDRDSLFRQLHRSQDPAADGRFDAEHRLILPDGSLRWTRTSAQTFFAGEGSLRHPTLTIGAVTDVTDQKRAYEELRKLASVVEMSNEFVGIATLQGQVIYLNRSAMQMVGLESLAEAQSKTVFDFFPESDLADARENLIPAIVKQGFWTGETHLCHFKTGQPIDVDLTGFQIHDEHGQPMAIATVSRDITERKRAAADKAKLEISLRQAQKMESIGRLAGGVAHDFNNMLTVILGFAELAKQRATADDPPEGYLDEISKAAERSRQMTQQLLGFSRQQIIAPKPANLNSIIEDLRVPLSRLIGEDVDLHFFPEAALWSALLDASQVNQILLNLCVNARDAMPGGGKLTIETANFVASPEYSGKLLDCQPGDYVVLAVSDSGVGMSAELQERIFEPFFTTKERGKGTGLGLATVYGIIRQNGGFINVYSEPGRGSTFRVYFPRLASGVEITESASTPAPRGTGRILLVEDDLLVRQVAAEALSQVGYTPLVATSPEDALRLCTESGSDICLMLTDVVMPGMTGSELRDRVNALHPEIKVLFMSGYTSNVIVHHGVLKPGIHFIQKPFGVEQLARKIAEVLGTVPKAG